MLSDDIRVKELNKKRVQKARINGLNTKQNELYSKLRDYGIDSRQACKMKYWSEPRIIKYLLEEGYIKPTLSMLT